MRTYWVWWTTVHHQGRISGILKGPFTSARSARAVAEAEASVPLPEGTEHSCLISVRRDDGNPDMAPVGEPIRQW